MSSVLRLLSLYHEMFDTALSTFQTCASWSWLTLNNLMIPLLCAFVKNGQIPLALVECHVYEKVGKKKLKSWTKHNGLRWNFIVHVSPKVVVSFQYYQRLYCQKYMIRKKWKKGKKNFKSPQSTPLPGLNGRGWLRKPWVIDITPHNIFSFGNLWEPLYVLFPKWCKYTNYSIHWDRNYFLLFIRLMEWVCNIIKIWIG